MLLIPLPAMAAIHDLSTVDVGKLDTSDTGLYPAPTVNTGIQLSAGANMVRWYDADTLAWVDVGTGAAGDTFNFGSGLNIMLSISDSAYWNSHTAIFTDIATGTFNLGASTIDVSGTANNGVGAGNLVGFYYRSTNPFSGTINGADTTIRVDATDSMAFGVWFRGTDGADLVGASVTFGDIEAIHSGTLEAGDIGATAFRAANLMNDTHVNLGHIKASTTEDTFAIGAHITSMDADSSMTIEQITARSARSAGGLQAANGAGTLFYDLAGKVTIGEGGIDVQGVEDSYGIRAADIADINLKGDTKVVSTAGRATGIDARGNVSGILAEEGTNVTAQGVNRAEGVYVGGGVTSGGNVTLGSITATATSGEAYGLQVWGDIAGNVRVTDSIIATGGSTGTGGAAGFAAYGVNTGDITLGDIETSGNWAVGAHFTQNLTGNLTIGDVKVESGEYEATGLAVGTYAGGTVIPADITGNAVIGNVTVASQEANAFGIRAGAVENLTLKGDIMVEGWGNDTSGIRTYDSTNIALLDRDVAFVTTHTGVPGSWVGADIWSDGNLDINLNGRNLNADYVKVDGGSNLVIRGNGNANVDVFNVYGDFKIGEGNDKTTVTVDGVKMLETNGYLGNVRFGDAGTLKIFGNTNQVGAIGMLADAAQEGHIVNLSTFTKWGYNPDTGFIESFGIRDRVFANDNYLAAGTIHNRFTGWHAVRDHVISGGTNVSQPTYGYYGQAPCDCVYPCAPDCSYTKQSRGAWVNYIGRDSRYQSSFNGNEWRIGTNGVQVGTDFWRSQKNQFGAFFGYEDSTASNFGDQIKAKDYYVGAYAVHVFNGGADFRSVFNYGWQDFHSRRNGFWGDVYNTSFSGNTAEVNLELGKRYYCGGCYGTWSTRPTIAVDWFWTQLGNGQEQPINDDALRYHKTDFSQLFFRFGTDLRYEHGRWAVESGIYYSYDMRGSDFWSKVSDVQTNTFHSTLVSSKLGRSILSVNVGGSYLVGKNLTLFGGFRGEAAPERAGRGYEHIGYVGGAWRW